MRSRPKRFQAGLPATVHEAASQYSCEALDLNREGVLLVGQLPRPESRAIDIAIRSVSGDLELRCTARVARFTQQDDAAHIGVRFGELDDEQRQVLEALVARVLEGIAPAPLATLHPASTPAEIRAALEKIPVHQRVAVAKRAMAQERQYLKYDLNPRVLEGLARNPNTNAREIEALLRFPDHLPTTLDVIARDARWQRDADILLHVATHPRVPLETAERLIEGMDRRQRQRALQASGLNPVLRERLVRKL